MAGGRSDRAGRRRGAEDEIDLRDDHERGRGAARPGDIPARGWKDIAVRVKDEVRADRVPLLAAGVAFYALLALVPAIVAVVSLYGLIADPADVEDQIQRMSDALPEEVSELLSSQLEDITQQAGGGLGLALAGGVLVALWSASAGMKHLMSAIGAAYDEDESRGFVKLRAIALVLTLGAVVFVVVAVAVIAVLPNLLSDTALGGPARWAAGILPYLALTAGFAAGLAVLYRYAPDRDEPQWRWTSWGAGIATAVWIVASLLFSLYASRFGSFNETYGSLAAVVVLMLWLMITAFSIILGAEINAEMEAQTERDTTVGEEQPMGERGAEKADALGPVR